MIDFSSNEYLKNENQKQILAFDILAQNKMVSNIAENLAFFCFFIRSKKAIQLRITRL